MDTLDTMKREDETPPDGCLDGKVAPRWKLIVSTDDETVHRAVESALDAYTFDDMGLEIISGRSPGETVRLLEAHPDAAVILLDAAAETGDAGRSMVRCIREELKNTTVRIILLTEREEKRPDATPDSRYDIDWRASKAGLSAGDLSTVVSFSLLAFRRAGELETLNGTLSREIARRKRAERELKEVARELSTLKKNLPGVAYRCKNDDGRTLEFLSEGCARLTGYEASDLLGNHTLSFEDLIVPEDRRSVRNRIQDAIWERRSFRFAYRIRTADGKTKWVWEQGAGVFSDSGELTALEGYLSDIDEHMETEQALRKENERLRLSMGDRYRLGDIVGKCAAMQDVYDLIIKASATDANVIVYGESGTGKKLVASAIHKMSDRGSGAFVRLDCADFPEAEIERKLLGCEKGAFPDADEREEGYLEKADGGTLYLDRIGSLGLNAQIKLLRVMEGGGFTPLGGSELKKTDIRFIAGADRDLAEHVRKRSMREDFFYRIHIIPINLPPLRERREDMRLLVDHFLRKYDKGDTPARVIGNIRDLFRHYRWPGNITELRDVLYRYLTAGRLELTGETPAPAPGSEGPPGREAAPGSGGLRSAMAKFEKKLIIEALREHDWHKGKVTEVLGIDRKTLAKKIRRHGIDKT